MIHDPELHRPKPALVDGSFRDPRARVYEAGDTILRGLNEAGAADFTTLERTRFYRDAQTAGGLVGTRRALGDERCGLEELWAEVLVHDRIPVVTYPYEWTFTMLQDAALLHLDLVAGALDDGISCKDGTAYNVQFVGTRPTFIDLGSFEPTKGDAWPGYRQFCALFLYPLLVESYLDISFAPLLRGSLDGITPDVAAKLLTGRARFRRGVLTHVTVQAMAARRYAEREDPAAGLVTGDGTNTDIVRALVTRLRKLVAGLAAPSSDTEWSGYSDRSHYGRTSISSKDRFVREAIAAAEPTVVVDLGCNDGRYAEMAAEHADHVVAVDADRRVIDHLYRRLRSTSLPILPMVGDLADPSPAQGWNLAERLPLHDRLQPDLVLSLALIHHLVIGRNIPIDDYLAALAAMAPAVVLEIPHRDDPMVRRLLAPKPADTHADYDLATIETLIEQRFEVVRSLELPGGTRTIYDLRRR